jgi:hypothetical protein
MQDPAAVTREELLRPLQNSFAAIAEQLLGSPRYLTCLHITSFSQEQAIPQ